MIIDLDEIMAQSGRLVRLECTIVGAEESAAMNGVRRVFEVFRSWRRTRS